ncbi:MAG: hypothetical protein LUC97_00135 [Clostridiales bacterium]|nr:hypothetical protein [Clostridiales bacterium]
MDSEDIVLFDIDCLISPSIKKKLDGVKLEEKIELLFRLLDYRFSGFSTDEIIEIEQFYIENTGNDDVDLKPYSLDKDDKDLIREYAALFPDYEDIKKIFNGLCNEITKEETANQSSCKIYDEYDRRKKAAADRRLKIIENLTFDDDTENTAEKSKEKPKDENEPIRRRSFDTILHQIDIVLGNV